MARKNLILHLRTTKANLDTQATAGNLVAGEVYTITDQGGRLATALSTTTYAMAQIRGLSGFCSGKPDANERIIGAVAPYDFNTLQANCSAKALVAASASCVFTIKKGTVDAPTTIGTFTFAASGTVATVSITAGSIAANDLVWIEAPSTQDATLADISFLIRE